MATPVNFMEKFLYIEWRAQQITDLLRARCYILSVKNDSLSTETLKLLHDTRIQLEKFENITKRIVELDNAQSLTPEDRCRREILERLWIDVKSTLCRGIYTLEGESNLLRSTNAPEHSNVLKILEDLADATLVFKWQFASRNEEPPE